MGPRSKQALAALSILAAASAVGAVDARADSEVCITCPPTGPGSIAYWKLPIADEIFNKWTFDDPFYKHEPFDKEPLSWAYDKYEALQNVVNHIKWVP